MEPNPGLCFALGNSRCGAGPAFPAVGRGSMSIGTILILVLIIALLGGLTPRFRGHGYGFGHGMTGLIGVILVVLLVLRLLRKI
jgi:Na+/melibiose symporter-like transporter